MLSPYKLYQGGILLIAVTTCCLLVLYQLAFGPVLQPINSQTITQSLNNRTTKTSPHRTATTPRPQQKVDMTATTHHPQRMINMSATTHHQQRKVDIPATTYPPQWMLDIPETEVNMSATTHSQQRKVDIPATSYRPQRNMDIPATSHRPQHKVDIRATTHRQQRKVDMSATTHRPQRKLDIPVTTVNKSATTHRHQRKEDIPATTHRPQKTVDIPVTTHRPQQKVEHVQDLGLPRVTGLIVNSSSCTLPDFSPWDDSVMDLLKKEKPFKGCKQDHPLTLSQTGLRLSMEIRADLLKSVCEPECCYRGVSRAEEGHSDDAFKFGTETVCFEGRTTLNISQEFIQVLCFCKETRNVTLYEDFRAFIVPKGKRSLNPLKTNVKLEDKLNVYMVGLDSVSMLNFKRYMPEIQKLLEGDFKAIPMLGLTKVGVNTFPNMIALLAGITMQQLNQSLRETPFDRLPLIWKQYSALGYETMYTEDEPTASTFNFIKKGFFVTPTDHYARPLYRAMQSSKFVARGGDTCLNERHHLDLQLQWLEDLMAQPDSSPQFALVFSNSLSHKGPLSYIKPLEPRLQQFLQTYRSSERYNSSILFFFSDHGMRFGPIMQTELGGYESRLPFFYILLPPWYSVQHPDRVSNLRVNSRRLTTFFDVHATLRDILLDAGAVKTDLPPFRNPGVSLFRPVPQERSCDEAGVAPHWCVCSARRSLPFIDAVIARVADAAVRHINDVLLRTVRLLCAELRLHYVTAAFLTVSETGGRVKDTSYRLEAFDELSLRLVTQPGLAEFEATVRCYQGVPPIVAGAKEQQGALRADGAAQLANRCRPGHKLAVMDVSRLNLYRGQSDCLVNYFDERRFCYCRNLLGPAPETQTP